MAIAFEVEERVARPVEVVWKRLTEWDRVPEWMSGVDSMSAGGPTEVGTELVFRARGKARPSEITHLVAGREITLTSRQGPVTAAYTYRCRGERDGTRVALTADCRIRGPLRVAGPVLRWLVRRTDGDQLRALKRVLEAGETGAG